MKILYRFLFLASLFVFPVSLYAQTVPPGKALSLDNLIAIAESIAGFLMIAGGILAGIVLIGSGIAYLLSGGDATKVKSAKDMLKAGVIGALIIFGFGVIVNTIKLFAGDPSGFF